jgi:alkylhydroperoxidase family enzyme
MSWIRVIEEAEAEGRLAELYGSARDPESGRVDAILEVHSLAPAGLEAHLGLYRHVMRGTEELPKVEREMVALVVSLENGCRY